MSLGKSVETCFKRALCDDEGALLDRLSLWHLWVVWELMARKLLELKREICLEIKI